MVMTMIYMLPMLLGRTFDIKQNRVGVDIYRQEELDNPDVINETNYHSEYRRIQDLSEAQNLLQISGELSLKIKSGIVNIAGSGSYLKDTEYRGDVVEILTVLTFKTISQSLPKKASPISGWENFPRLDLGTHYVSSITYGGELLASLKFRAVDEKYIESIKVAIDGALQAGSAFDLSAVGKLDKLQKDLSGQASLEITYYATVPLKGAAQTIEGLRDLVQGFQEHVKEVNGGIGVPIRVELTELASLNDKFVFRKQTSLKNKLRIVEAQFDDLLQTENSIQGWLKKQGNLITEDQENEIDDIYAKVLRTITIFKEVINNIDFEKGPEQLDRIIKAYKAGGGTLPGKYRRMWDKLQQSLVISDPKRDDGNSVYVRWGRTICNGKDVKTLTKGYMAASTEQGLPSNAVCLPEEPYFVGSRNEKKAKIAGIRYGTVHLNPFDGSPNIFDTPVRCSVCFVSGRNTLAVMPMNECPKGWQTEYKGYYLAGRTNAPNSEAICVDASPELFDSKTNTDGMEKSILVVLHKKQAVPCVVCSKK